jgi:hypothetical protein
LGFKDLQIGPCCDDGVHVEFYLERAILMRRTGTSRLDVISKYFEKFASFWVVENFSTLVNQNIFVGDVMELYVGWCGLGDASNPIESMSGMIDDEEVTGLNG